MNIVDAQREVRTRYVCGFYGQLASQSGNASGLRASTVNAAPYRCRPLPPDLVLPRDDDSPGCALPAVRVSLWHADVLGSWISLGWIRAPDRDVLGWLVQYRRVVHRRHSPGIRLGRKGSDTARAWRYSPPNNREQRRVESGSTT